jgi:hypothetical protein
MAKRFTDTDIWKDDWFYELSVEYKLFWFYLKDDCNHAGIWKPKTRVFKSMTDVEINLDKALQYFNAGKQRIRVLHNGSWFIEDFFLFQYTKKSRSLNLRNRVHESVLDTYLNNGIIPQTVKGLDFIISKDGVKYLTSEFDIFENEV